MNVLLGAEAHRLLSVVVNSAKDLSPKATFHFNAQGFFVTSRGDTSAIKARFLPGMFDEYQIPDGGLEFGFDLELLGNILEVSNEKVVQFGKDGNVFNITINPETRYESRYEIRTLDSDGILPTQDDAKGSVNMHSEDLANICSHLSIAEIVRIEFAREYIQFSTTENLSGSCTARRSESGIEEQVHPISFQIGENQLEVPISIDFELKQLRLITNAKDIAELVTLDLMNWEVYPLRARYRFPNERGYINFYLGSHKKSNFSKMVELAVKAFDIVKGNMENADQAIGLGDACANFCGTVSAAGG